MRDSCCCEFTVRCIAIRPYGSVGSCWHGTGWSALRLGPVRPRPPRRRRPGPDDGAFPLCCVCQMVKMAGGHEATGSQHP